MKLVEVKLKYRSINKYKVLSHLLSYFLVKKGLSKVVVKIPARRLFCEIYMAWYFLQSSIADISPHYLRVSINSLQVECPIELVVQICKEERIGS